MNIDRSIFVAINDFGKHGLGATDVDPSYTRADIVENIRRGEHGFDDVRRVFEFNPTEGWAHDITADVMDEVAAEVRRLQDLEDFPLSRLEAVAR